MSHSRSIATIAMSLSSISCWMVSSMVIILLIIEILTSSNMV